MIPDRDICTRAYEMFFLYERGGQEQVSAGNMKCALCDAISIHVYMKCAFCDALSIYLCMKCALNDSLSRYMYVQCALYAALSDTYVHERGQPFRTVGL